jgi:hypothetical protein
MPAQAVDSISWEHAPENVASPGVFYPPGRDPDGSLPDRTREWSGTLVAEWTEGLLSRAWNEPILGVVWAVLGIFCAVDFMAEGLGSCVVTSFWVALTFFGLGGHIATLRRAPFAFRWRSGRAHATLVLTAESVHLATLSKAGQSVTHLSRGEAGLLIRCVPEPRGGLAAALQLRDMNREVRLTIADRFVHVTTFPFGSPAASSGLNSRRVQLSTLLGTWWPKANKRQTWVSAAGFPRTIEDPQPWGQPDLDDFAADATEKDARAAAWLLTPAAVLGGIALVASGLTGSLRNAGWLWFYAGLALAAGLWWARRRWHAVRREIGSWRVLRPLAPVWRPGAR